MLWSRLVLLLLNLGSVCCIIFNFNSQIVRDENSEDIGTTCKSKLCIPKCCGKNEYVYFENSSFMCERINPADYTNGIDSDHIFWNLFNVPLYDNHNHDLKKNKNLSDVLLLETGKFIKINKENEENIIVTEALVETNSFLKAYLSEGGSLYLEYPNTYDRWKPVNRSNFCIDIDDMKIPMFWIVLTPRSFSGDKLYWRHSNATLIISSVFFIIVLLVHLVLPELRDLALLILMTCILNFASTFISLRHLQLLELNSESCIALSGVIYFFYLSSFFWMSVVSFHIWWTLRNKTPVINPYGKYFIFGMYCIYAWGVPMLMTIGLIAVNEMDLSAYPWIVKPQIPTQGCFLTGGQKFVYLYIPILILIILNCIFYLMAAFKYWRLVRRLPILNSSHRSDKQVYEHSHGPQILSQQHESGNIFAIIYKS